MSEATKSKRTQSERIAGLETAVESLEDGLIGLSKKTDKILDKVEQSNRMPWQAISVGLSAIGIILGLVSAFFWFLIEDGREDSNRRHATQNEKILVLASTIKDRADVQEEWIQRNYEELRTSESKRFDQSDAKELESRIRERFENLVADRFTGKEGDILRSHINRLMEKSDSTAERIARLESVVEMLCSLRKEKD